MNDDQWKTQKAHSMGFLCCFYFKELLEVGKHGGMSL